MGGKTKQSQRTKNNVRPSSSSRSAELLSNAVSADGALVNPSTGKVLPALFPTLAAANFEQGLNPEFQMCIKKLNKKDPITKAKVRQLVNALQELCELVNNGDVEDVVAALPSWAHFYKILTVDTDRKVREMTQVCHGAVLAACGRRAAPRLRLLLPAWLQAQYDDHAPAMAAACNSLKNTFPDSKLPEVISFCKAEVMAHLADNLIGSAEAVISKKIESVEEKDLQLCRVITSSLQGLEYFVQHLPVAHSDWLWAELAPLLQANVFWKYATHDTHQLRAAWYGAMGRIIERYKTTFGDKYGVKTLRVLLAAAKEPNSLVAAQLWSCLLLLMHNVEGWHTYLDKKELLTKRILDVLENGGWGDARHLSNMLLPLLAHLPQDMLTKDFYEAFFKAIYIGLEKKNILNSKSERQSWITSLAECLRYLSVQQNDFVVGVATGVHRTWLEKILSKNLEGPTKTNLIKCSSTNMASIIKYWLKQSKEENSEKYDQLVRNFWQNVGSTILAQIDKCSTDPDEIGKLIDAHILLLQTLKTSLHQEAKKQQSIKFDGDEQTTTEKTPVPTQQCDESIVERYQHNLDDLAQKICSNYFEFASKKEISNAIMTPLITLLVEFDSKNLYVALARQFDVDTVYKFYDKVLRGWLAGDTMRCRAVVDIVFLMIKHLSEEEQALMFNTFQQFPPAVEEWCLRVCVSHPHSARAAVRAWLRGAAVARTVARVCARAVSDADRRPAALLLMCLAADETGEMLISSSAVSNIIETFSAALAEVRSSTLEQSAGLAAQLATALHDRRADQQHADLLHRLFALNIHVPRGNPRLSVDTWCEVRSAWQDGVAALPEADREHFLQRAADFIHTQLFQDSENLDIPKLEHMVSTCPHLFTPGDVPGDVTEITTFTERLFNIKDHSNVVTMFALRHECVTSQLNCLDENDNEAIRTIIKQSSDSEVTELTKTDLVAHINKFLFRAIYLRTMFLYQVSDDDEDGEQKCWCDALLGDEYLGREFCNVLYHYVVLNSLHEGYGFWAHYTIIQQSKQKLDSLLSDIIKSSSQATKTKILSTLSGLAAANGYFWSYARRWYEVQLGETGTEEKMDVAKLEDVVSGSGFFHNLQASTKWSANEDRDYETKYLVMLRSFYAAYSDVVDEAFVRDAATCQPTCDLDVIVNAYYRHNDTMLYEMELTSAAWLRVVSNVSVVEFMCAAAPRAGWHAPARHWDFTTITLCSLLNSVERSKRNWGCTKVAMMMRSIVRLYVAVQQFIGDIKAECVQRQPLPHVADLTAEWRDIFAADLHGSWFSVATHVLTTSPSTPITSNHIAVLGALVDSTGHVCYELAPGPARAARLALPRLVAAVTLALREPVHHALKYFAYYFGKLLAVPLVLEDAAKLSLWSDENQPEGDDEKERPELSLDYFDDTFVHLQEIVEAALSNVALCEETCEMVPMSDSHSMALGWLLLADLMATVCSLARGDLVHHHIQIYRERKYAEPLLATCVRLLPAAAAAAPAHAHDHAPAAPAPHIAAMFIAVPPLSVHEPATGGEVAALACRGVYTGVCGAGCGAARGWWAALPARPARALERLVRLYVAPPAARDQLRALQRRAAELEDTEIRIAWLTSEVSCVYNVEERAVELRVLLSPSHPLAAPRLVAPHAAGGIGASTHWLALYLAYQNGTILNALKMWTRAVNARVESAPQCYICYCRLQPATGRLPRVPCHQCNNKFHNVCLRKWFTTSNKSTCPLCRSNF